MDWIIKIGKSDKGFVCIVSHKMPNGSMAELLFVHEGEDEFKKGMNSLINAIAKEYIGF